MSCYFCFFLVSFYFGLALVFEQSSSSTEIVVEIHFITVEDKIVLKFEKKKQSLKQSQVDEKAKPLLGTTSLY
jgi:hypothetical protein